MKIHLIILLILQIANSEIKNESFKFTTIFEKWIPNSSHLIVHQRLKGICFITDSMSGNVVMKEKLLKLNLRGQREWEQLIGEEFYRGMLVLSEINSDGILDFVLFSGIYDTLADSLKHSILIIDGKTGAYLSRVTTSLCPYWGLISDRIGDFDGDGVNDGLLLVLANIKLFSLKDGEMIWERDLLSNEEFKKVVPFDVFPSPSRPVIHYNKNDKNYEAFLTFGPYLWCLNAKTGFIKWRKKEEEDIKYKEDIRFISEPLIIEWNDKGPPYVISVILLPDLLGFNKVAVCAYNALTGENIWKTYLNEYPGWWLEAKINHFYFSDIPVLVLVVEGSDDIFMIEGKKGFLIYREKLPFSVSSYSIVNVDSDSLPEIIFLGSADLFPSKKQSGMCKSLFIYDIKPDRFNKKIFAKDRKYDLVPEDPYELLPTHIKEYYSDLKQIYKSCIPDLSLILRYDADENFEFQFVDDIDGDGFVEVIMLTPPSNEKDQKLRLLRIIPVSDK